MSSSFKNLEDVSLDNALSSILHRITQHRPEIAPLFQNCFTNTLHTTIEVLDDGLPFVITGDIPAMWLRDSSAQIHPYILLARDHHELRPIITGVIQRQAIQIQHDAYANAFNREMNGQGHQTDHTQMSPLVWERKFELDSLCYPVWLCREYWDATQDRSVFTKDVHRMFEHIIEVMKTEQYHDEQSSYSFQRDDRLLDSDTLPLNGKGTRTNVTGMVWSGFRPSDDACKFGYHIPDNMFAAVILGYIAEFAQTIYDDISLCEQAKALEEQIRFGINTYAIVNHPQYGQIYAYETDGFGNYNLMDDANIPSLLAIPYLRYCKVEDEIYQNTRAFILSKANPTYYEGQFARGVGSPHTPGRRVWHLGLLMQGLTASSLEEQEDILAMVLNTTDGTGYMHESFDPDNPSDYSRAWFAWANSLFSEFVLSWLGNVEENR